MYRDLSDHPPVTAEWNEEPTYFTPRMWRLNNFLLESPGQVNLVENEIGFFVTNRGSTSPEIVWYAFKALRGILYLV